MQRLKVKEVLKPSASNGAFCILFVAVDKKYAAGGTGPTKEKHPSERKRKPAKRERIPTTSLRTGLGMTGLAYERIFSSPIKSTLPCTVSLRGNRRSAACGGYSEAISRKCPVFTPQRGWKPADTTVFRIAEAPPVADEARRCWRKTRSIAPASRTIGDYVLRGLNGLRSKTHERALVQAPARLRANVPSN